jgi:REP element-mobilizing transposase RayT
MRRRFAMRIYGYVIMPEHVHLLVSEPEQGSLAEAMHYLKLSFSKRVKSRIGGRMRVANPSADGGQALRREAVPFWQNATMIATCGTRVSSA